MQQQLNIACDVFSDITGDMMSQGWTTRTSGVPRGLLRFLVINMLMNKPMSGVEIVEVIETETGGRWKPSSGSVYPLLAKLHERGYTVEEPSEETGIKRYAITKKGKQFFEKQISFGQKLLNKLEFLVPLLIAGFQFYHNDEKIVSGTRKPAQRVVTKLLDIRQTRIKLTEEHAHEIENILNKCADELEIVFQKITEKKQNTGNN